tara:strand:+ start:115 stop:792 length:678 start_codon:yes stop_codon:yes gene_type:complete
MNKAYLLVICLLAASFTGCLSDDTSDLEEQQNTEDETIEPVGNHNNETDDYDMLIGELQNLTNEIEELGLEIKELQESEYQPPENSNFTIYTYSKRYDENNTAYKLATPNFQFFKEGNTLIIEYAGPSQHTDYYAKQDTDLFCTDSWPSLYVYNSDGVIIEALTSANTFRDFNYKIEMLCELQPVLEDNTGNPSLFYNHWSRITKTFSEEPARVGISSEHVYTFQ